MKITVTPICQHPRVLGEEPFYGSGASYVGQHVVISTWGVWIDGESVIQRDRRIKVNREPGHNWIAEGAPWTGFQVDVDPEIK